MYRAYQNERGTWNVERFSHTSNVIKTVQFGLTREQAERFVHEQNWFVEHGL